MVRMVIVMIDTRGRTQQLKSFAKLAQQFLGCLVLKSLRQQTLVGRIQVRCFGRLALRTPHWCEVAFKVVHSSLTSGRFLRYVVVVRNGASLRIVSRKILKSEPFFDEIIPNF